MSTTSQKLESASVSLDETDTVDVASEYVRLDSSEFNYTESTQLLSSSSGITAGFWLGKVVLAAWIITTLVVFIYSTTIADFVRYIAAKCAEQGCLLYVYYILLFALTVPLFMSIEVLAVAAGFIYARIYGKILGITLCSLTTFVAYVIAMSICFLLSRYLVHDFARRHLRNYRYYHALSRALEREGFKIVTVIRVSPFLPAAICSYILGTMNITFLQFNLGSFGALPSFFYYSYLGSVFEDLTSDNEYGLRTVIYVVVSVVITVLGLYYAYNLTNRYLPTNFEDNYDEERAE